MPGGVPLGAGRLPRRLVAGVVGKAPVTLRGVLFIALLSGGINRLLRKG